jgi:glycosyltransferase involved in cell wall biosynthesis
MNKTVDVSVIMATYNTEIPMLREAVDSILHQTFTNFEFLIIDDGSTDDSVSYLNEISDPRVRIIRNPGNMGITKSLNVGLREARGRYIARMDADDVSLPERLQKEFDFMESHPDVIVCGTRIGTIDETGRVLSYSPKRPHDMEDYRVRMLFQNPGPIHPTAFFNNDMLQDNNITYNEELVHAQDYGMWETVCHYGTVYTLDDVLLHRRKHNGQISSARRGIQIKCDKITLKKILTELLDDVTDEEVDLHYTYSGGYFSDVVINDDVDAWYDRLLQANKEKHIYNQQKLEKRILTIKKNLVRQTIKPEMGVIEKMRIAMRYLPFIHALKTAIRPQ